MGKSLHESVSKMPLSRKYENQRRKKILKDIFKIQMTITNAVFQTR